MSYSVSLSGMNAAATRIANSANNVANIQSTSTDKNGGTTKEAYRPTDIVSLSQEAGGVKTIVKERNNPTISVAAPDSPNADNNGTIEVPNVDLSRELVEQKMATYDYKANLKALEAQKEMDDVLLDIKT
jgi:flagellar basal-body rod protein FlgC